MPKLREDIPSQGDGSKHWFTRQPALSQEAREEVDIVFRSAVWCRNISGVDVDVDVGGFE